MTEAVTASPDTPQTTPAPPGDALPPELAFLKERGEDISEFLPKEGDAGRAISDASTTQPEGDKDKAPAATEPPKDGKDEEAEPGEVIVGDDGKVRDAKGRFVPKAAYMRQSERAKTAEAELARLREEAAVLRTKLELAAKAPAQQQSTAQQPKNPFDEPDIDPSQDLVGALQQVAARQKWQREQHAKAQEQTTAALTEQQVTQAYRDDTARFMATQPDYPQAFEHVVRARAAELIALGITDQKEIARQIKEDEAQIVRQAIAAGRSPAQMFYSLAVARGYQLKQQQPATQQPATPAGKTQAEQMVDAINAGQASGKTLTGAGAGGGAPGLTVEQYLAMPVEEIVALKRTAAGLAQLRAIGAA